MQLFRRCPRRRGGPFGAQAPDGLLSELHARRNDEAIAALLEEGRRRWDRVGGRQPGGHRLLVAKRFHGRAYQTAADAAGLPSALVARPGGPRIPPGSATRLGQAERDRRGLGTFGGTIADR